MKSQKPSPKLSLQKHTLRQLSNVEIDAIAGGISSVSNYNTCRGACGGSIVYGCGQSKAFNC